MGGGRFNPSIITATLQRQVFNSANRAKATIVVDGQIVGTWAWETASEGDTITWQLLTALDPTCTSLIQKAFLQLAAFIGPETSVAPGAG